MSVQEDENLRIAIPVEVLTVSVQRSTIYIETEDPRLAVKAVRNKIDRDPQVFDDDEYVVYTHEVNANAPVLVPERVSIIEPNDWLEDN